MPHWLSFLLRDDGTCFLVIQSTSFNQPPSVEGTRRCPDSRGAWTPVRSRSMGRENRASRWTGPHPPTTRPTTQSPDNDEMPAVPFSCPPCPEGAKQVSPGQSEAAQPRSAPWVNRAPPHVRRPEGAKQTRDKHATNAKSCVEMIRQEKGTGVIFGHVGYGIAWRSMIMGARPDAQGSGLYA
jgi:hypothetical protein